LTQIKHYRPISLVNTDTKIFTRTINFRLMQVPKKLVNEHQLGFIPGRCIAENVIITQIVVEHTANFLILENKALTLLLD
jgi:hypothetical protein